MNLRASCDVDVVIDTNVLSHSDNANAPMHASAMDVIMWLRASSLQLVLDDQGKTAPDPSTSVLYAEYRRTLAPQGFAITVFMSLLSTGRVSFSRRPAKADRDTIRRLVPRNTRDQAVLGAAIGSTNKVLVSNDDDDFDNSAREAADTEWGVSIVSSDETELNEPSPEDTAVLED